MKNPQKQQLKPGTLSERVKQQTQHALSCGALHSLSTDYELIEQDGIEFLVRILTNLVRKDAAKAAQPQFNPFLPYEEDLWVGDISDTHVCILNKFNVVDEHLLIITREFVDQECLLTLADFEAIAICLSQIDGLVFYNGGKLAGASQKHKHLQLLRFPLVPNGANYPLEVAFNGAIQLPFLHAVGRFEPTWTHPKAAITTFNLYRELLLQVGLGADENNHQSGAYNLLLTREKMIIIPRSQEDYHGISINSLGFAGTLLVRNQQQMQQLKTIGILNLLSQVGIARS